MNEMNPTNCRQMLFGFMQSVGSLAGVAAAFLIQNVKINAFEHTFGYSFIISIQMFIVAHLFILLPGILYTLLAQLIGIFSAFS